MKCRRIDLDARDELLASLDPNGQAAVRQFVENLKTGFSVTMKKSELASYRLPE